MCLLSVLHACKQILGDVASISTPNRISCTIYLGTGNGCPNEVDLQEVLAEDT